MAGMQFEYDEKGGTFYYFLLSFIALVLIPATIYLRPKRKQKDEGEKQQKRCHCDPCQMKKQLMRTSEPWTEHKRKFIYLGLAIGWVLFFLVAYKASQAEVDFTEYDPFKELGIDRGASTAEIKKAYRALSKLNHPDKGGDPKKFMRIAKAYAALTDEETRHNWEVHGNPDGPGATHFGIALPKWIVEKQNSVWVLAAYGLIFIVLLPVVVGMWWYRSIKYNVDQILLDTTQLYYYYFHRTPNMILKRVIMILGASLEFEKGHNNEIVERPSDNEEYPALMRELPQLNEKNKEKPLCFPYSVRSRALLHAHLSRLELPPKTLEKDKQYVTKKCPFLVNEMISIIAQLVALYHANRISHCPRLDTLESCMKLSQMVVQALWENKSPLMQLPHITEDMMRFFVTKRRSIRSISQLVSMKEDERRSLLRTLTDDQYRDVMNVCAHMPHVTMEVDSKVLDDEDSTIAAKDIVTVVVRLVRENMEHIMNKETVAPKEEEPEKVEEVTEEGKGDSAQVSPQRKPKVWEKNKKKKKGGGKPKKKPVKPAVLTKKVVVAAPNAVVEKQDGVEDVKVDEEVEDDESVKRDDSDGNSSDDEVHEHIKDQNTTEEGEEEDWISFQEEAKKENALETKSKETHEVHCPYFPSVKQEWWWVYVADRKKHSLITAPVQICSLKTEEEVELKFSAPAKPGVYTYTVCLKSDSYLDFDLIKNIRLEVKAAKKVENHPQWEMSDEEEEKEDQGDSDGDISSDYEDSEED